MPSYILFGEWMAAKHSIHYNKLPDTFIAFDLYDQTQGKFLSHQSFRTIMDSVNNDDTAQEYSESKIFLVPSIQNVSVAEMKSMKNWVKMLKNELSHPIITAPWKGFISDLMTGYILKTAVSW